MQKYNGKAITDRAGNAIPGATITVRTNPGGLLAELFSDKDGVTQIPNPVSAGTDGEYSFYAANGRYDLTISATGYVDEVLMDETLFDPADEDYQPRLTAGANITISPDGTISASGASLASITASGITDSTPVGRSILTAADAPAIRTTLGLGSMALASTATYAPLESPGFTGTPTVPTGTPGNNTTQAASCAFVQQEKADRAPLASPAFTGIPTAPTAATGTNTTQLSTTAFVQDAILNSGRTLGGSGAPSASLGANGDTYIRNDGAFAGVIYLKAAGAWSVVSVSYNMTTLPTASSSLLGCVVRLVDTTYAPEGKDLECVTYDGSTYWWVPAGRISWTIYYSAAQSAGNTGNTSYNQIGSTFNLPNRDDIFVPGKMYMEMRALMSGTGTAGQKRGVLQITGTATLCEGRTTAVAHLSYKMTNGIAVRSASSGISFPYSSNDSGSSSAAPSTYSFTWKNAALAWVLQNDAAGDTSYFEERRITFHYA